MFNLVQLHGIRDITDHGQNGPRTKRTTAGQNGPRQGQKGPRFKTKRTMFKDKTDHAWDNQTIRSMNTCELKLN